MKQPLYHGILVNKSFRDPLFPTQYPVFSKRVSKENDWIIYGIEIQNDDLLETIQAIQENMLDNEPWYAHMYNDEDLIVIFKNKVFYTAPNSKDWEEILAFGRLLGIPAGQLDFRPNLFQDEKEYFQ